MPNFNIAFWNLQNLFDTNLSAIAADFDFTPDNGWTETTKNNKIQNLASVINEMFNGNGPDILGICEIENKNVANELITMLQRNDLKLAHVDSPDIRGIDCSLIYSEDKFELINEPVEHLVHLRYPTRDIFEVKLKVKANNAEIVVLVNHWPSRSRGKWETEPYRVTVASQCGRIVDDYLKMSREEYIAADDNQITLDRINDLWNKNILIMGDFNDEPYDRSILLELQASKGLDKIEEPIKKGRAPERNHTPSKKSYLGKKAFLYNCSWIKGSLPDTGTYHYSPSINTMNMLDQIIISRGLLFGSQKLKIETDNQGLPKFDIYTPEIMRTSPDNIRPKKFTFERKEDGTVIDNGGFSDHFPITTSVKIL